MQTIEFLAMVYTWTVSLLLYLLNGREKWDLKLCAYKTPVGTNEGLLVPCHCSQCCALMFYSTSVQTCEAVQHDLNTNNASYRQQ